MQQLFLWTVATFVVVLSYKVLVFLSAQSGMLSNQIGGAPQPERVQLIALTVAAAATYGAHCLSTIHTGTPELVEPASWIVSIAGGSNLLFLIGKSRRINQGEQ